MRPAPHKNAVKLPRTPPAARVGSESSSKPMCPCERATMRRNPLTQLDPTATELLIGVALIGGLGLLGYLVYTQNQANQQTAQFYQGILGQIQAQNAQNASQLPAGVS
jgi:uncharacterized protein HemX